MKETCTLINNSAGRVVYNIRDPECTVRREIYPGQVMKDVKVKELEKLLQQPGGAVLFYNYLHIDDEEVLEYLSNGRKVVPEYWLTEKQIPYWISHCPIEEFQDALDFAPEGIKDLIKQYAVSEPLNDYAKRQALLDQCGFDVTKAIESTKTPEQKKQEAEEKTKPVIQTGRRASTTSIIKPAADKK